MGDDEDEVAEEARLDAEKARLAAKKAARLEKEKREKEEKARIAALRAAESTRAPEEVGPASTPTPAPREVEAEIVEQQLTLFQAKMLTSLEQFKRDTLNEVRGAVQQGAHDGVVEAFRSKEGVEVADKIADRMGEKIAKKMPAPPPYKRMFAVLCCLGFLAFVAVRHVVQENHEVIKGAVATQLGGINDLVKQLGTMTKSLSKAQRTLAAAQTVTSSAVISAEKKHSVVVANYKVASPLKAFEVIIEGGKMMNKFICIIEPRSARQIAYDGDKTKLLVTGDVGDAGRTQPEDFSNGLWIWAFDDAANKGGMKTQDSAFMPK